MHQQTSRRARRVLSGVAVALAALSCLVVTAGSASASGYRVWTFSGVTFEDGGTMSGSFAIDDGGSVSQISITTSGGDTAAFGDSTTYDDANVTPNHDLWSPGDRSFGMNDSSRYIYLDAGDLTNATDGEVRALDGNSYECLNCWDVRHITSGSLVAGSFVDTSQVTLSGTPGISGTPTVGQTLTGDDSTVTPTPSDATLTHQWLRDGNPIPGATDTTYTLTPDDAGATITFEVGGTDPGHPDATPVDSSGLGPVQEIPVTLSGTPGISGTPQVGQTLTGDDSTVTADPSDATLTHQWLRDGTPIAGATDTTYTLTTDDLGSTITFEVGGTRTSYTDAAPVESSGVGPVEAAPAPVALSGTPGISGTPTVGQTLTGDDSTVTADPSDATLTHQWLRDGTPIAGATDPTYTLTTDDLGAIITFEVGATHADHPDATPVDSSGLGPVAAAPATTPTPATIVVHAPTGLQLGGRHVTLSASGLSAGEPYVMRIGGIQVASGTASGASVSRSVVVPRTLRDGRTTVSVAGVGHSGSAFLRVVQPKRLGLVLSSATARSRGLERITVSGLAAGERVTVRCGNRVISAAGAVAGRHGTYQVTMNVGPRKGLRTISVVGQFTSRTAATTFRVLRAH